MAEILKSLGFNVTAFGAEIVIFVALLIAMDAIFWKPLMAHMSGRDRTIADKYHGRDALQHEMEALRADYLARIAAVEAEARSHIQQAIKEAQQERERLIAEAREQAETTIHRSAAELEREKAESLVALRSRMVGIATGVADAALASTADRTALQRAVEAQIVRDTTRGAVSA
jgi:F-type H+-transporting ATPase subunit b